MQAHGTISTCPIDTRHTAAIQRIGALAVEQDRVDAERRGAAKDAAEVLVIAQLLHHSDAARPVDQRADYRLGAG